MVLLPSSHPLSQQELISSDELERETMLLLGKGHCFRDQVLAACPNCASRAGEKPCLQKTLEGASLETIRMMITSGVGITILPCSAAGADRYSERLLAIRRFRNVEPSRTVALAWRNSFPRPKAIETLRKAIGETALSCVQARL
jgi:LysR family hydrogen peroxide-inducible transcriptional activator